MIKIVHASHPVLSTKIRSCADDSKSRQLISMDVNDRFPNRVLAQRTKLEV